MRSYYWFRAYRFLRKTIGFSKNKARSIAWKLQRLAKDMEKIKVKIVCPNCNSVQYAIEEEAYPFWIYVHECTECKYLITESEWEKL